MIKMSQSPLISLLEMLRLEVFFPAKITSIEVGGVFLQCWLGQLAILVAAWLESSLGIVGHMPLHFEVATFYAAGIWIAGHSTTAECLGAT